MDKMNCSPSQIIPYIKLFFLGHITMTEFVITGESVNFFMNYLKRVLTPGKASQDHFNEDNHSNNKLDYKINIVGQESNKNRRLRLEEAWVLLLNTHYPNGLNSKWWHHQKIEKITPFTWSPS